MAEDEESQCDPLFWICEYQDLETGWVVGLAMTGFRCSGCTWAARDVYCTTLCDFLGLAIGARGSSTPHQLNDSIIEGLPWPSRFPCDMDGVCVCVCEGTSYSAPARAHTVGDVVEPEANAAGEWGRAPPSARSHPNAIYV